MNKGRLEAFTDAVLAIAATIMVLELKTPVTADWKGLAQQGITFLAYFISFMMIYGVWYAHHNLFLRTEKITGKAYLLNGLWIVFVSLVPFVTGWVGSAPYEVVPEFLYALLQLLCTISFNLLSRRIKKDNPDMVAKENAFMNLPVRILSYVFFAACMGLAFVYPPLSLYISGIVFLISLFSIFMEKE